jgi:hypothetical protein
VRLDRFVQDFVGDLGSAYARINLELGSPSATCASNARDAADGNLQGWRAAAHATQPRVRRPSGAR